MSQMVSPCTFPREPRADFREGEGCRRLRQMQWVLRGHLQNAPGQREVNEMSSDPASPCRPPLCLRSQELGRVQSSQGGEMGHCTQMPFSREEFTGGHSRVGRVYAARKPTVREGRGGGRRGGASGWPEGKRMNDPDWPGSTCEAPGHLRAPGRTWCLQDGHLQLWAPAGVTLLPP